MSATALVLGGTRFIGRHTVSELLDHGYAVTVFNRGTHDNPFADDLRVSHVVGDRRTETDLQAAVAAVSPDVVFDFVAYHPGDVVTATDIVADVDAYVYVSSGSSYAMNAIPKRERDTPLHECTPEQAVSDDQDTYGNRKAAGDRAVFEAADRGVNAMAVRPTVVYGPHDYTERLNYWIDRVCTYDRVIVPGDGGSLWQLAYVVDVARALRIVAERGTAGEAYNVGDRRAVTLRETVETLATVADTECAVVPACADTLAAGDLAPNEFVLYRDYPHLLDTCKLADLGWDSTPVETAFAATIAAYRRSGWDGSEWDPGRELEERVLNATETLERS